jgi:hypothetical protein
VRWWDGANEPRIANKSPSGDAGWGVFGQHVKPFSALGRRYGAGRLPLTDPNAANGVNADGYTELEVLDVYLNSLVIP